MAPRRNKTSKPKPEKVREKIDLNNSASSCEPKDDRRPCSSSYCDSALVFNPQDVKEKLMIASNITVHCEELNAKLLDGTFKEITDEPILERLHLFTNVSTSELKMINDSVITRDRSFAKTLRDIRTIPEPTALLLADDIRTIFVKYIIAGKTFPSKMALLRDLRGYTDTYCNEPIPIQRLVRNKLIKYEHFPQFNRYLLHEHPEKVYKRTVYLNNIKNHRLQSKRFAYVEVRKIVPAGTASGFIAGLIAIPSIGKLEQFFAKYSTEPIAMKWLQQRSKTLIQPNCVVVLAQPKMQNKYTPHGKRFDFVAWLDKNNIPYAKNAHTAELYELYTRFKGRSEQQGAYDQVFLNAGLPVIQLPSEWRKLNFFKSIWANLNIMNAYHPGKPEILKQNILTALTISNLDDEEERLIKEELKMLKEDAQMEEIIENVKEMAIEGKLQTLDFPKECCGDKTDYSEAYVSDYVTDIVSD